MDDLELCYQLIKEHFEAKGYIATKYSNWIHYITFSICSKQTGSKIFGWVTLEEEKIRARISGVSIDLADPNYSNILDDNFYRFFISSDNDPIH